MKARDNPFSTDRVLKIRFRPQDTAWPALLARLEALNFRAAIVGPEGSGKTTLLEDLKPVLEARGLEVHFLFFNRQNRRLLSFKDTVFGPGDAILCDGAEQLSRRDWRRLKSLALGAGAFVITSHRAGLLPAWIETSTSPALLREIAAQLGEILGEEAAGDLWARHEGNLRHALRELYDRRALES